MRVWWWVALRAIGDVGFLDVYDRLLMLLLWAAMLLCTAMLGEKVFLAFWARSLAPELK